MRKMIILVGLLFSTSAFANDGGSAYLEVLGINPEGIKKEKMSFASPFMSIYGKEARAFAKTLPTPSTVALGMMSEEDRRKFIANERSLSFFSNGWVMQVSCSGGEVKSYENPKNPKESLYYEVSTDPRGFKCGFYVAERSQGDDPGDWLGDAFKFNPIDQENPVCE